MIHKKLSYSLLLIDMLQVYCHYIYITLHLLYGHYIKKIFLTVFCYEWSLKVIWSQVCQLFGLRRIFPTRYEYVCGDITFIRQKEKERRRKLYHKVNRGNIRRVLLCFFIHASRHLGSQFPNQGLNSHPQHWKCGVWTTGPPGKSCIRRDLY